MCGDQTEHGRLLFGLASSAEHGERRVAPTAAAAPPRPRRQRSRERLVVRRVERREHRVLPHDDTEFGTVVPEAASSYTIVPGTRTMFRPAATTRSRVARVCVPAAQPDRIDRRPDGAAAVHVDPVDRQPESAVAARRATTVRNPTAPRSTTCSAQDDAQRIRHGDAVGVRPPQPDVGDAQVSADLAARRGLGCRRRSRATVRSPSRTTATGAGRPCARARRGPVRPVAAVHGGDHVPVRSDGAAPSCRLDPRHGPTGHRHTGRIPAHYRAGSCVSIAVPARSPATTAIVREAVAAQSGFQRRKADRQRDRAGAAEASSTSPGTNIDSDDRTQVVTDPHLRARGEPVEVEHATAPDRRRHTSVTNHQSTASVLRRARRRGAVGRPDRTGRGARHLRRYHGPATPASSDGSVTDPGSVATHRHRASARRSTTRVRLRAPRRPPTVPTPRPFRRVEPTGRRLRPRAARAIWNWTLFAPCATARKPGAYAPAPANPLRSRYSQTSAASSARGPALPQHPERPQVERLDAGVADPGHVGDHPLAEIAHRISVRSGGEMMPQYRIEARPPGNPGSPSNRTCST